MEQFQEKEIDIRELVQLILSKWWLITIFVAVSVIISTYISLFVITPMYEASSTLFIGKEANSLDNFEVSFSDLQVDNKLVADYRELIKTRLVTEEVITELGLDTTVGRFTKQLTINAISDSRFIHISFKDADPALAKDIANQLSKQLVEKASDIVGVKNIQIVDLAIEPQSPITPRVLQNILITGLIGLILSVFCIMILHVFDNTVKSEEDLEKLDLVVLGVVPKF